MIKTKRQQNKDKDRNKRKKTRKLRLKGKQTNKTLETDFKKEEDLSNKQFTKTFK